MSERIVDVVRKLYAGVEHVEIVDSGADLSGVDDYAASVRVFAVRGRR